MNPGKPARKSSTKSQPLPELRARKHDAGKLRDLHPKNSDGVRGGVFAPGEWFAEAYSVKRR